MIRYPTEAQIYRIHARIIEVSGGLSGVRAPEAVEAALGQMRASFGGVELYPGIKNKALTLGFALAMNHPFVDGNKRVAFAAMATFLDANGYDLNCTLRHKERVMLDLAASNLTRAQFSARLRRYIRRKSL